MIRAGIRWLRIACVVAGALLLWLRPDSAPIAILAALLASLEHLAFALRRSRGTALGAAIVWAFIAVGLGALAEACALTESRADGLPWAGHLTYLATLAALASLLSVLNARTPGGGAWAILMALLVVVFLIPWMESAGLRRAPRGLARLSLAEPWTIFYGLLVVAGVTNYLPTRFGPASACLALGFGLEYVGLTRTSWPAASRGWVWIAVPWTFAAALVAAEFRARAIPRASNRLDAIWFWFRDHWGVVWALRVMERFNRSAEAARWPVRLTWHGATLSEGTMPDAALATFKGLLRRFARPERIEQAEAE